MKLHKKYLLPAIGLFIVEVLIAIYVNDRIIRPYIGDLLVVILLYCAIKSLFTIPVLPAALGVLLFAFFIEILQYYRIVYKLGLGESRLALVVVGSSFEWIDLLAYTLGILLVVWLERKHL